MADFFERRDTLQKTFSYCLAVFLPGSSHDWRTYRSIKNEGTNESAKTEKLERITEGYSTENFSTFLIQSVFQFYYNCRFQHYFEVLIHSRQPMWNLTLKNKLHSTFPLFPFHYHFLVQIHQDTSLYNHYDPIWKSEIHKIRKNSLSKTSYKQYSNRETVGVGIKKNQLLWLHQHQGMNKANEFPSSWLPL